MRAAGTSAPGPRIAELDALRGLAVVGIAWMNVHVYAMPAQAYYNPLAWGYRGPADLAVWWFDYLVVEDQFRAVFALLFGAGIAIQLDRAGPGGLRGHVARMAVLFLIGVVHATLFASNDILRCYALAGLAVPLVRTWDQRRLLLAAAALLLVHLAAGTVWLMQPRVIFDWGFGTEPQAIAHAFEWGREGFGERIVRRLLALPDSLGAVAASVPLNLATMLIGVAAWRSGLLALRWRRGRQLRLGLLCAAAALPPLLLMGLSTQAGGFDGRAVAATSLIWSAPSTTALGVAYAAGGLALFRSAHASLPVRLLAAAGRLSLTNYVMTSVVFAGLFASWGLGWFGAVSRSAALALSFVPIVLFLAWSLAILRRFGQGPLEWLWRQLALMFAHRR